MALHSRCGCFISGVFTGWCILAVIGRLSKDKIGLVIPGSRQSNLQSKMQNVAKRRPPLAAYGVFPLPRGEFLHVLYLIPLLRRGGAKRRGGLGLAISSKLD